MVCPLNVLFRCMLFKLQCCIAMGAGRAEAVGRRMHCAAVPAASPCASALQFAMVVMVIVSRCRRNAAAATKYPVSFLSPGYCDALSVSNTERRCENAILRIGRKRLHTRWHDSNTSTHFFKAQRIEARISITQFEGSMEQCNPHLCAVRKGCSVKG